MTLQVGRRVGGTSRFPAKRYVYTGSALNGCGGNTPGQIPTKNKKLHGHIDYLVRYARIVSISVFPTSQKIECALNRKALKQSGAQVIAQGFGYSDCRCPSHRVFLECSRTSRPNRGDTTRLALSSTGAVP